MFESIERPLAIAMWDFSWLERRWPGAGYEDWSRALDELSERGYDAIRIDAYPHLFAEDVHKTWDLLPRWYFLDWGAPCRTRVQILPHLTEFIALCKAKGIRVALSSWYREDVDNVRMHIADGRHHAQQWIQVLDHLREQDLLDTILYVDLCNEWPLGVWAPYFLKPEEQDAESAHHASQKWMSEAVSELKSAYPEIPATFSLWPDLKQDGLYDFFDFLEPHIWMVQSAPFYDRVGYKYDGFDIQNMERMAQKAEPLYRSNEEFWQNALRAKIDQYAEYSIRNNKPLCTTECWGVVEYKDWPLLDWGWVKELCELGTLQAAQHGRWFAIATSNFCGPQFHGMWRDVEWHQRLTKVIHEAQLPQLTTT